MRHTDPGWRPGFAHFPVLPLHGPTAMPSRSLARYALLDSRSSHCSSRSRLGRRYRSRLCVPRARSYLTARQRQTTLASPASLALAHRSASPQRGHERPLHGLRSARTALTAGLPLFLSPAVVTHALRKRRTYAAIRSNALSPSDPAASQRASRKSRGSRVSSLCCA